MRSARFLSCCCLVSLAGIGIDCAAHAQAVLQHGKARGPLGPPAIAPAERVELDVPGEALFQDVPAGIGLSRRALTRQDGTPASRNGVVASWSISPGMQAGVGLFSVTDERPRPAEMKRNWSARDVAPRHRNIAAVGVKVSF